MRAIPGVQSASLSWYPPISDDMGHWTQAIGIDGAPVSTDLTRTVYFNAVSPTYFDTVGMRMIHGRDFTPADDRGALRVAIVNESLARQFFPGQDPVGRRITIGRNSTRRDLEILGVVTDAKYQRLQETPRSIAYLPCAQLAEVMAGKNLFAEIRSTGPIAPVVGDVRRELQSLDARVPLHVETVRDRIDTSLVRERVLAMLAVVLGLVALTLACSGLYGLLSYAISRQMSEIGLRLALGASRSQILGTVLWQGLTLASVGTLAGTGAAMAFGRFAHSLLFQVSPTDPAALTAAAAVMLAVAACAVFVPAWRAASVDPVVALRHE
jgi:predicted permease